MSAPRLVAPGEERAALREPYRDELAEMKALAAILDPVTPGCLDRVINWLRPEHFAFDRNRKYYEACCALADAGTPATPTAVTHWLQDRQRWDGAYDFEHMLAIAAVPFEIRIEENARRIVNKHTMERVVRMCEATIAEAAVFAGEAADFANRFERKAAALAEERERREDGIELFSMQQILVPITQRLFDREPVARCTTGVAGADDDIGGLAAGTVTIAAADTNWGKTNLAIMVADENLKAGKRVLVVTCEDSEEIYGRRILARRARVNAERLRDRTSDSEELTRIAAAVSEAETLPFLLRAIGAEAEVLAARIRRICERDAIDLVVVDYIQAIRMGRRMPDRRTEVNEVARLLTNAVKNARAAGLFFSQIKRLGKGTTKPTKHDLKESGDLENAAEAVLLGYRVRGAYRLLIDKSKDGSPNEYELAWDGNACCFNGGALVLPTAPAAPGRGPYRLKPHRHEPDDHDDRYAERND